MRKILLIVGCVITLVGCTNTIETTSATTIQETEIETSTIAEIQSKEPETETQSLKRDNTDFRNAYWGDDIETVKKYEECKTMVGEESDCVIYEDTLLTYDTYIIYNFENNKLYETMYGIKEKYSNSGQYIPMYEAIKNTLKEIYGEPIEDAILPLTNQSLIDSAGSANALSFGYVTYRAQWETETTNIMIGMQAQNFEVNVLVSYKDKNYKEDVSNSGL